MSARILPACIAGIACLLLAVLPLATEHRSAERASQEAARRPAPPAPPTTPEQGGTLLARQPVAFVPNLGQWDGPFSHKARMGPMTVFLQDRGWTFTLEERPQRHEPHPFARMTHQPGPASDPARGVAVRMHFGNGAGPAIPIEEDRLPGVHNYFLGNDPDRWQSNVPLHASVLLDGLYPGIDLRARSDRGHFEYDLLLEPGADLERVVVEVEGADGLRLDTDGTLIIDTVLGPVRQPLPKTWQVTAYGDRQEVACRYVLRDDDCFGFEANDWDPDLALVVDPGLVYSTLLGGGSGESPTGIVLDGTGAPTICGSTGSTNFPTTTGAFNPSYNAGDAFVTRLNSSGGALTWSTYLGGGVVTGFLTSATAIATDPSGNVTVCGSTSSSTFPSTPGAFDTSFNGGVWLGGLLVYTDGFVTRLNPTGSALIYSTFLGGGVYDSPSGLAVDASGAATVVGSTTSTDFPFTPGAYDTTHSGGSRDGFVTRLNPSGSALVYSTYLGGSGEDWARDLALDANGAVTVCGNTDSLNFPVTTGAYDTTYNGGGGNDGDVFVAQMTPSGSALVYSTFLGGAGDEVGAGIELDATGAATVCGRTSATNFPTTPGAFDTTFDGSGFIGQDAFVTQLDPSGGTLLYSTFLGGSEIDGAVDIELDATGAATVVGFTGSANFATTPGAFDTSYNGPGWIQWDAFVTRLDPSGSALVYSTYLGGPGNDGAAAHALDANGVVTVCGVTNSTSFPTTGGAFATVLNGPDDAFVTRLDMIPGVVLGFSQPGGPGTPINIDNANLIPGNEYYNIFSLDLCPGGPGTGPYLGLCVTTLANAQFIVLQASLPVGSPPFHFVATAPSASWGPYIVGPGTLDAVCLDVTGGVLGSFSPVTRITIQ